MDREKFVLNEKITNKLLKKGIDPSIKGFKYLHDMVELTIESGCTATNMQPYFQIVGNKYGVSKRTIERGIKYVADKVGRDTPTKIIMQIAIEIELENAKNSN